MKESLLFRPAKISDIEQLVNLMNSQYARKKNQDYFVWQYFQSYYPTTLMCAVNNDKVIAMLGMQQRILINGAKIAQLIDILVDKEWRGRGIFKQLAQKAIQDFNEVDLLCSFCNQNGKLACEKQMNFTTLAKIDQMSLTNLESWSNNQIN